MKEVYYPLPKEGDTTYIKNARIDGCMQDDGLNDYIKGANHYVFREIYLLRNIYIKKHIILYFLRNILNISKLNNSKFELTNISRDKNLKKILSEYSFLIYNYSKMYKNDKELLNFYINCYNIYNNIICINNAKSYINISIHKNSDRNHFNSNNMPNKDCDNNIINYSDYTFYHKPYFAFSRKIEINNKKKISFLFVNKCKFYVLCISSNFNKKNDTDYLQGVCNLLDKHSKLQNISELYICKDKSYNFLYMNILEDYQTDIIKLLEIILFSVSSIVSNFLNAITNLLKVIIIKATIIMYYFSILNYKGSNLFITYNCSNMSTKDKDLFISLFCYSHNKNYFKNNCKTLNDSYNNDLQVSDKILLYSENNFFNTSLFIANNLIKLIKKNYHYNFFFDILHSSNFWKYTEKINKNYSNKFDRCNSWNKRKNMINYFSSKYYNSVLQKNGCIQLPFLFFYYYNILNKIINILKTHILENLSYYDWNNNSNYNVISYISIYRIFLCANIDNGIKKYLCLILKIFNAYNNMRLTIIEYFKNIEISINVLKYSYSYNNSRMRININSTSIIPIKAIFKKLKFLLITIFTIANYVKVNMMIHFCNYFINYSRLFVSFLFLFLFLYEYIIIHRFKYISIHKNKPNNREFNINTCNNNIYEHIRYNTEQICICDNIINKDNMSLFFPFVNNLIIILFFLLLNKLNEEKSKTIITNAMLSYLHFIYSHFNQDINYVNNSFRNEIKNILFYFYHKFVNIISIKNEDKIKKQTYLGCAIILENYYIYIKLTYFFCVIIYLFLSSFVLYTLILISIKINLNKYNYPLHIYLYIYMCIFQNEDKTEKNDKQKKNYIILTYHFFVHSVIYIFHKYRKFIIQAIVNNCMNKSKSYFNVGKIYNIKNYLLIQNYKIYFIIQTFLEHFHCFIVAMASLCTTANFVSPLKPKKKIKTKNMKKNNKISKANKHIIINHTPIDMLKQNPNISTLNKLQLFPHKMLNLANVNINYNNKNDSNSINTNRNVHSSMDSNETNNELSNNEVGQNDANNETSNNEIGQNDTNNEPSNSEAGNATNGVGKDGQGEGEGEEDDDGDDDKKKEDDLNGEICDNIMVDNKTDKVKKGRKKKLNDKSRIINKVGLGRKGRRRLDLINNRDENNMGLKNYYNSNYINEINNQNFIQNNNIDEINVHDNINNTNIKTVNYSSKVGKDIVNQLPNQLNSNFNIYQNNRINMQFPPNYINQNNLNMNNIIGVKQIPSNINNINGNFRNNIIKNSYNQINRNIANPINHQINANNNIPNYNVYMALQKGGMSNNIIGNSINKVNYRMNNSVNYNNIYSNINNSNQFSNVNNPKINNMNIYVDHFNKKNNLNIPLGTNNNPSLLPTQINSQLGNNITNKPDSAQLISPMNKLMNDQTHGHIDNQMLNPKQMNFMNNHNISTLNNFNNNVSNMISNNYINQNPYKPISIGSNTYSGVNKNKMNENIIINNSNNIYMNNVLLRDKVIENNKIANNNNMSNIAINTDTRRNNLLGLNMINNNNDANVINNEPTEMNGMKTGIDKYSNISNNINNTNQIRKNGSRSSSCSSVNNEIVNEKPTNINPNIMGSMIYMNNRNIKNEQMEKMIIYDNMGIKNEENQSTDIHNRNIVGNISSNIFYGYNNNILIHPYFNNTRVTTMRNRVSFGENNNRNVDMYDSEQMSKGNILNNNYITNMESYNDYNFHKNKHINTANNTNLKKKKKNDMKKKKDEEMANNQNLRTVKMNWNKFDNIFRKINLKNNYDHIINTEEEDKINDLTDLEKENSKVENINNNIIDSIGINIDAQLNINFHKFLKEYDDILKKLNLIKLNDKASFKNQSYTEIYENIFLTIESYLNISNLQYKNNFVHTNFYKNCIKYLDKIKPEESEKNANTVKGSKERNINNSNEKNNNNDEENCINKKKSNFFESISLSADNSTVLRNLLKKIKDIEQIENNQDISLGKNNKIESTKGKSNITEFDLFNQKRIQLKLHENENEPDIEISNILINNIDNKNSIHNNVSNFSGINNFCLNENNQSIMDGKKTVMDEKNIAYQNLFIENILSKKYRTFSINEFINVKLNDNLCELIRIYKKNLCYNIKKSFKKNINYIKIYRWLRSNVKNKYIKKNNKLKNNRLIKKRKKKIIKQFKEYIHSEMYSGKNYANLFEGIYKIPNIQRIKINNNQIDPNKIGVGDDISLLPFNTGKTKKGVNSSPNINNFIEASKLDAENNTNDGNLLLSGKEEMTDSKIVSNFLIKKAKNEKQETKKNRKNNKITCKLKSSLEKKQNENVNIYIQKEIKKKNPQNSKINYCRNLSIHAYIDKMYNKRNIKRIKKYKKNINMKYKSNAIIDLGNKIVWVSFEFNNLNSLKNIKNYLFETISLTNIQNKNHSENELNNFIINEMEKYKNVKIKFYKLLSYFDFMFLKNRLNFVKVQYKKKTHNSFPIIKNDSIKKEKHIFSLINYKKTSIDDNNSMIIKNQQNENQNNNHITKEIILNNGPNENDKISSIDNITESNLSNLENNNVQQKNEKIENNSKIFNKKDMLKKNLQEYIELFPIIDKKKLNSYINLNLNIDNNDIENISNKFNGENIFGESNLNFITKYLNKNMKMESADLCKVPLEKSNEKDDSYDHYENRFKHFINNENIIYNNSMLIDNCIWSNNPILFNIFEKYYLLVKMQKYILQYKKCLKNNIKMDLCSESNLDLHSSSTSDNVKTIKRLSKGKNNKGENLSNLLFRNNQKFEFDIDNNFIKTQLDYTGTNYVDVRKRRISKGGSLLIDLKEKVDTSNCSEKMEDPDQTGSIHNLVNNELINNLDSLNRKESNNIEQDKQITDADSNTLIQDEKKIIDNQENALKQNKENDDNNIDANETLDNIKVNANNKNENHDQEAIKSSNIINEQKEKTNINAEFYTTFRGLESSHVKNIINEFDNKETQYEEYNNIDIINTKGRRNEFMRSNRQDNIRKNILINTKIKKEEAFNGINENNVEVSEKKRRGRKKGKKRGRKKGVKNKSKLFINEMNQSNFNNNKQTNFNGNFTSYDNYKNNSLSHMSKEQINQLEAQNENDILDSDIVPIDKDIIIDLLCEEDELIESYIKHSRFVDKNLVCLLINMNNVQKKLSFICNELLKKIINENKMPPKISENTKKCEEITYKYIMFERWNQLRYSLFYNIFLINNNIGASYENINTYNNSNINSINAYNKYFINSIFDLHKFATKYKKHKYPPFEYSIFFKHTNFKNIQSITYESDDNKSEPYPTNYSNKNIKTYKDEINLFVNDKDKFCGFSNTTDLNITPIFYHCCICFNDDYNSMQFFDEEDNVQNASQNDSNKNVKSISGFDNNNNHNAIKENKEVKKEEHIKNNIKNSINTNDTKIKDKALLDENKTKNINISGKNCKENILEIENNIKSCKNIMLKCYRCYMHAHKYCYISIKKNEDNNSISILQNNNISNPNEWLCQRCEFEKKTLGTNYLYLFDSSIKCYICLERGGAFCQIQDHIFIHIFCAIFCVPDLLVNNNINMQNFYEYIKLNSLHLNQEIYSLVQKKYKVKRLKIKKIIEPTVEEHLIDSIQSSQTNLENNYNTKETKLLNKTEMSDYGQSLIQTDDKTNEIIIQNDEKENNSQNNNIINANKKGKKKKQDINNSNKRTRKIYEFFSFIKKDKETKLNQGEEDNDNLKKKKKKTSESSDDGNIKKDDLKDSKNMKCKDENLGSYLEDESHMSSDYLSSSLSEMSFFSKFSLKEDNTDDQEIEEKKKKNYNTMKKKIIKGPYILNGYEHETTRCNVCLKTQGILMKCFNMDCEKYMHPLCAFMCGLHIKCKNSNKKFLNFQNKIDYCFPRIFFFIRCINHSVKKCGVVNIYEELIKRRRKYLNRDLYPNIYENIKKERKQKNSLKLKIRNNNLATSNNNNNKNDVFEVLAYNFNYLYPYQYSFFLLPNIYYIKNDICSVCFTKNKKKELLYCKYCNVCVHKTCYLVDTSYIEYFYYKKKKKIHTFLVHSKEQKVKHLLFKIKDKKRNIINMLKNKDSQSIEDQISISQNGEANDENNTNGKNEDICQKIDKETTIKNSNTFKELLQNEINSCLNTASHFNDIECVKMIKKFNKKSNSFNYLKKEEEKLLTDLEDVEEHKLFICDICANNYNYENANCILCSRKGGVIKIVKINDYIKTDKNKNKKNNFLKHEKNSVFIHMQCALYSPQIIIHDISEEYYQLYNYDNLANKEQFVNKQKKAVHSDSEILQLNKESYYDKKQKMLNEFFYKQYTYTNLKKSDKTNSLNIKKNSSIGAPRGRPPLNNTSIEPISENIKVTSKNNSYENKFNKMELGKSGLFDSPINVENKNKDDEENEENEEDENEYDEKIKRRKKTNETDSLNKIEKKQNDLKITNFDQIDEQVIQIKNNNTIIHSQPILTKYNIINQKEPVQTTEKRRGRMRKSQSVNNNKKEVQSIEQIKRESDYKIYSINNGFGEIVKSDNINFKINNLNDNNNNTSMILDGITYNNRINNNCYYNLNKKKKKYKIIIKDQLKRYLNKNTCYICNMTYGYTHKCIESSCNNYFHISCAKIHNFFFEYDYNFLKAHPNITNLDITKIPNSIIFCEVHSKNRRKAKPSIQLFSKLRSFLELANIVVNQIKKKEEIKYNWIQNYFEQGKIEMQSSNYKYNNNIEDKNTKLLTITDDLNYCENNINDNNFNYKYEVNWENNYTNLNNKDENILNSSINDQFNSEISKKEYNKNYFIKKNIMNDLDIIADQLKSDESNLFDDNESDINDSDYTEEMDNKNKDLNNNDDSSSMDDFKDDNNSE
ncbi:conserved Plasmodium protein, unknown function [Plasmodium berghei]|uniref:Zinc finger PHD-type domain-containing protein n=1 Tax=Plasmodium berghei TaxID=5821 RepID=A0A113RT16_PLABE|nr:conserved Plasmodium protein, unknown function [Plasmodium berghei]